uniref:Choline kinase n=1 Tax=Panagrolaimus sp. JU765 TaxID=591449 RepID=A0AC34QUQ5_9BILA
MVDEEIDLFLNDFDKNQFKKDVEFLLEKIDFVKNQKFEIKKPELGLTNKTYFLKFEKINKILILRIDGENTEFYIDRKFEKIAVDFLSKNNFSAKIYLKFRNGLICGFIPGKDLKTFEMIEPKMAGKIAKRLAQLHSLKIDQIPEISSRKPFIVDKMFLYFEKAPKKFTNEKLQKEFENYFVKNGVDLDKNVEELVKMMEKCRPLFAIGHNDLVVGNLLYDESTDMLNFIDYEYVDLNYRQADIGNFFMGVVEISTNANYDAGYDSEGKRRFLKDYLEEFGTETDDLEREIDVWMSEIPVFEAASHLLWSFWSLFQAEHSSIDFDYIGYAIHRHQMYLKQLPTSFQ